MGKRKIFVKTNLCTPRVNDLRTPSNNVAIPLKVCPPKVTAINLGYASGYIRSFDFKHWYNVGIDPITYACQKQIERFLDKQDIEVTPTTIRKYCDGLKGFFNFLTLQSAALQRELNLNDINRQTIDGYLGFLRDQGSSVVTQKSNYNATKSVLKALCIRGLIEQIIEGDTRTFPRNPFPGAQRSIKGESPLSMSERKAFTAAVKTAVMPIFSNDIEPTSTLLAYALLVIALHTGRNTSPLLEMKSDCLRSHPKDNTLFLVLYKRRGYSTSKVALRGSLDRDLGIESLPTVRQSVGRLVRRVIELSDRLRDEAPEYIRHSLWLYRMQTPGRGKGSAGSVSALNEATLCLAINALVKQYNLVDCNGKPLRVNVSRLRKTFINRIYEILDGDVAAVAAAAGNTVGVTGTHYLRPSEDSTKNWKFMGVALVEELLANSVGATERTPVGQCTDNKHGDYAPKKNGASCMNFLSCLRCRNYVVTGEDLHRLFSFYWRIYRERTRMPPHRWQRQFGHIVRLIDRDVIETGLAKGIFSQSAVDATREHARCKPHPFWAADTIILDLAEGLI